MRRMTPFDRYLAIFAPIFIIPSAFYLIYEIKKHERVVEQGYEMIERIDSSLSSDVLRKKCMGNDFIVIEDTTSFIPYGEDGDYLYCKGVFKAIVIKSSSNNS